MPVLRMKGRAAASTVPPSSIGETAAAAEFDSAVFPVTVSAPAFFYVLIVPDVVVM